AVKTLEQPRLVLDRDARAGVGHAKLRAVAATGLPGELDASARRRVLAGVVEQVDEDLLEAARVGVHGLRIVTEEERLLLLLEGAAKLLGDALGDLAGGEGGFLRDLGRLER